MSLSVQKRKKLESSKNLQMVRLVYHHVWILSHCSIIAACMKGSGREEASMKVLQIVCYLVYLYYDVHECFDIIINVWHGMGLRGLTWYSLNRMLGGLRNHTVDVLEMCWVLDCVSQVLIYRSADKSLARPS